ncbi:MAG: hypothetical protein R3A79_28450 [Nannocystaceae bacterium]
MSRLRPIRGRRSRLQRLRRANAGGPGFDERGDQGWERPEPARGPDIGWDRSAAPAPDIGYRDDGSNSPLQPQILSLLADPRVDAITIDSAAAALAVPRQDVETAMEAMRAAGTLIVVPGPVPRFAVPLDIKDELEQEFVDAAEELGEHALLARISNETALAPFEDEEPRLPATAGLLSLFLPGTGQLLNGDIGRASLVFAVWSIAWITHLAPVWTFVCLYAGAEAFFTAKIRSMERKMRAEARQADAPKKLPSPRMT